MALLQHAAQETPFGRLTGLLMSMPRVHLGRWDPQQPLSSRPTKVPKVAHLVDFQSDGEVLLA